MIGIAAVALVWTGMLGGSHPHAHRSIRSSWQSPTSPSAQSRVFLLDDRVLLTHGECAWLPQELVCVVKLGGGDVAESFDVLTVPRALVNEARTAAYADVLRAAHYGATRGDREYAELTTELARVLAELERSTDRDRRLGIAQVARARLAGWSADHFGYKTEETRQLVALLDDVIAELRIAAGETTFSLDLVANLAPVASVPILPAPDVAESLETALASAAVTQAAAERLAILRSARRVAAASVVPAGLRARVDAAWRAEESSEREYRALFDEAITRSDAAVRQGRPSAIQRLQRDVAARDQQLGARRPREMAAFNRRLESERVMATTQQQAFVRWQQVKSQLLAYELALRPLLDGWVSQRPVLDSLRDRVTPQRPALDRAARRFAGLEAALAALRPVRELADVHAVFRSAVQMARVGLELGERLTVARNPEIAGNAAAAIAGAELLLAQARRDLVPALNPRKVR